MILRLVHVLGIGIDVSTHYFINYDWGQMSVHSIFLGSSLNFSRMAASALLSYVRSSISVPIRYDALIADHASSLALRKYSE